MSDGDAAVLRAMEVNQVSYLAYLPEQIPGMEVIRVGDLTIVNANVPSNTFNCVAGARLGPDDAARRVAETIEYFRRRELPFAWWVGPESTPPDLDRHLLEHGLPLDEMDEGMAMDLGRLEPFPLPDGFAVRQVETRDDLAAFAGVLCSLFEPPDPAVLTFYNQVPLEAIGPGTPMRLYLGLADGVPAATSAMYLDDGVAGIYSVSTVASYRGRGFGTAMTVQPLVDAVTEGYQVATLQASGDGQRIYARVGFTPMGTFRVYQ